MGEVSTRSLGKQGSVVNMTWRSSSPNGSPWPRLLALGAIALAIGAWSAWAWFGRVAPPNQAVAASIVKAPQDTIPKPADKLSPEVAKAAGPRPKAVAVVREHDFGFLDPSNPCSQVFTIRNEGDAPLKLERGRTSCTCTMSAFEDVDMPPGAEAKITVSSKLDQKAGPFHHTAAILTNDPEQPTVIFTIRGVVAARVAADPPRLVVPVTVRGKPTTLETAVYSQTEAELKLVEARLPDTSSTYRTEPLAADELKRLGARSGFALKVTPGRPYPFTRISETIELVLAGSKEKLAPLSLEVAGDQAEALSFYSPHMIINNIIRMGNIDQGKEFRERVTITVRDEQRSLGVVETKVDPPFVQVKFQPLDAGAGKAGLYQAEVRIPPDAPACSHHLVRAGRVVLKTDHPRIREIAFTIDFAIVGKQ